MENVSIFYGSLEYFTVIWKIFWPLSKVVAIWYIFTHFGILCQEKSGNPAPRRRQSADDFLLHENVWTPTAWI
jgi:hypothetical protein